MSRYWGDFPQYSQPNAAELKKKSAASKKKEKAKGKVLKPVIINGRAIVSKWWGKAWCDNLVQGTRKTPYKVEIRISPLSEEKCQAIIERCGRKLENLEALLAGDFPEEMQELFQSKDGLFPAPQEISFSCSCPDWALLCKHVAAALYGVGARLDENPRLFFELRGIEVERFVDVTLANRVEAMLAHAGNRSSRMMDEEEIIGMFGVL